MTFTQQVIGHFEFNVDFFDIVLETNPLLDL